MRKKDLKHATTGVVITVVSVAVLFGVLRAGVLQSGETLAHEGAELFADNGCAHCHYTDRRDAKIGPGLKGLFDRETLPVSGRPVSEGNVRAQLEAPYKDMPSFADRLTDEERDRLVDYLKTL